jgi:hypothetical protein
LGRPVTDPNWIGGLHNGITKGRCSDHISCISNNLPVVYTPQTSEI